MKKIMKIALAAPLAALFPLFLNGRALADNLLPQEEDPEILIEMKPEASPEKTVDILAAKSSDWREPSLRSEEKYKGAIRRWLSSMPSSQREITHKILLEAHPEIHALRSAIRDKKRELANLSFNMHTTPEALPRLGQELQALRRDLNSRLLKVTNRLKKEAGVSAGPLDGDSFWIIPQDSAPSAKPKSAAARGLNS